MKVMKEQTKFFLIVMFFFVGQFAKANLANAPEAPLTHCFHWLKERSQGYLSFKYRHAEKTGGEFTFYTTQGGHAAGEGIYCSKTILGSYSYGDRVVRLDFTEDTVFRTVSGKNVCSKESGIADCESRTPDVISYSLSSGWYVIKRPEVILSWSANSDQLRADFVADESYKRHGHLINTLSLMDAELQQRPKITYFNPNARKGLLKLLEKDENIARVASEGMVVRVLKYSNAEMPEERKIFIAGIAIAEMARTQKIRELARLYIHLKDNPNVQQVALNAIRASITPEVIAGIDLAGMLELDAIVPEMIDENVIKAAFANTLRSTIDIDGVLAVAANSEKVKPLVETIVFDEARVSRLRNKTSILVALKNTVTQGMTLGDMQARESVIRLILVTMSNQFSFPEVLDLLDENRLFATENLPFLFKYFFESRRFTDYQPHQVSDILSRIYAKSDPKAYIGTLMATIERLAEANWLEVMDIVLNQSYLLPHIGQLLPSSLTSLAQVTTNPENMNRMIRLQRLLLSRAKASVKEVAYIKGGLETLVQHQMCVAPASVDFSPLEEVKNYPTLLKETITSLLSKKDSGLNIENCSMIAFASAMDKFEKKLPNELSKKLWARFDAIPLKKETYFHRVMKKEYWTLNSMAEWKVAEKIVGFVVDNCKEPHSHCNLKYAFNNYLLTYFYERFENEKDGKTQETSRFISRLTDYLAKKTSLSTAWISFQLESLFYKYEARSQFHLKNYIALYGHPKVSPAFKKRFESFLDSAFDPTTMDYVVYYADPNRKFKQEEEDLVNGSRLIFQRIMDNTFKRQYSWLLANPNYELGFRDRDNGGYRNLFCLFVSRSLRNRADVLANRLVRPIDEVKKELMELYEKNCEIK